MKKLSLLTLSLLMILSVHAQTVITKDFNDYQEDAILNGQDGWVAKAHSAGGGQFKVEYLGGGGETSPDESLAVFFDNANTNYGEVATHKSTPDFQFDFSQGGTIEIELDVMRNWWGTVFGVGYDADGDGVVLPPMNYETTQPNPNLSSKDGGIYFTTTGHSTTDNRFVNGIVLPDNKLAVDFKYEHGGWTRWKIMIDLEANDRAGSVTLFSDYGCTGEFQPVPEVQGINAGLKPGSGDRFDPAMWDGIFFLNSSHAGYDNLLVRHIPAGLASQFIEFPMISDQLISAAPIELNATATSGLPVSFELLSGPATLDGNILTITGEEGVVKVKAVQNGDSEWQAAPSVTRTFEVIDPSNYTPEITIRRPYDGTMVYVSDLESPIMIVLSAYVEHGDAIKFESVTCDIDGEVVELMTSYPDDPENGYWYTQWTPTKYGTFNMTANIEQSGGKVTSVSNTFEVTNEFDNISVTAFDGDLVISPQQQYNNKDYAFPTHVNAFNKIDLIYNHNCAGTCDPYDRVGSCRVKNYRGEWVELYRYVTPFGGECDDKMDVTDYTSLLQGLVEFELYFQTWDGQGYNPTAIFDMTKGKPEYKYVNLNEIWYGIFDFGDYRNRQPVPTRFYTFDENVEKANLKITTTGHNWSSGNNGAYNTGNAAEFYDGTHNIIINDQKTYEQHLWRTCNPNPAGCQPQAGTWTYNRSGWCPGSLAMVWDYSLDEYIEGSKVKLFYELDPSYIDECHPNYPDCVNGQNNCPNCLAADNPILRVSGMVVTYSNEITSVYKTSGVGVKELQAPFEVGLYPNPATDVLRLTTDYDKGKVCVHIVNMQGQEVRNFVFEGSTIIDISDFAPGMYFVNVIGGQLVTKKLVVK